MLTDTKLQLSIILPIYNVEPFLDKCVRSLEDQDIPKENYEIICVIDGSPDNCKKIVESLQKEFSNIVLIDQENQGVSMARNNGIKASKGEYILFVDPDDSIEKNSLNDLLKYARLNDLEIVYSPFTFLEMNGDKKETYYEYEDEILAGPDLYFAIRLKGTIDPDHSVAILYKREFLIDNQLYYLPDVPFLEDGEFIGRVCCLVKRGSTYNVPYYIRLNRPGSATKSDLSVQKRAITGYILAAKNLKSFKNTHKLLPKQEGLINGRIIKFITLAINASVESYKKFRWVKKELKKAELLNPDLDHIKTSVSFGEEQWNDVDNFYLYYGVKLNYSIHYFYGFLFIKNLNRSIRRRLKGF